LALPDQNKGLIVVLPNLLKALEQVRSRSGKIVFTNGCFDILHFGHVSYLNRARELGDVLVVGLNSDAGVKRLKGDRRPICSENERAEVLASLRCVDYVVLFDEDTPINLIKAIEPDFLVKGGDWPKEKIAGGDFVEKMGGVVCSLPLSEGFSTTSIIEKILKAYK